MSAIGERLRLLREESGQSQAEFAEQMGVNRMTINNYENGRRTPDIGFAANAAQSFNVTLEYLTGKTEFRHREDMLESVHKANRLMNIIEKMPQIEGQQMMLHLSQLLENAHEHDTSMPVLVSLINTISELSKILSNYTEIEENIVRNVAELKWQQVQPPLIQWTCMEKTKAINEAALDASKEVFETFLICSQMLSKKLAATLETESEK